MSPPPLSRRSRAVQSPVRAFGLYEARGLRIPGAAMAGANRVLSRQMGGNWDLPPKIQPWVSTLKAALLS